MSPGTQVNLAIALIALAAGSAAGLVALLIGSSVAKIPPEDRRYKDKPPLGFRLLWWPIQWCGYALRPFISNAPNSPLSVKLRKAGLEYCINAPQFIAARIVAAFSVATFFCWILNATGLGSDAAGIIYGRYWKAGSIGAVFGWFYVAIWLKDQMAARKSLLQKTLPFYIDLITLCVEAGLNLQGALSQAVAKGPKGALRDEIQRVLRDVRAGKARADALRNMSDRLQESSVTNFVTAMIQAERMGMNLGPMLRAQADQRRSERFLRAEKLAMEAPVKLLFPLIVFIFPCTFIVLFFPIGVQISQLGL
ncbi:MAG: type II secretion system F family protein [Pseudomonadota bacterium]